MNEWIPERIREQIQVNLPFRMRHDYLDAFLSLELNPEIGIDAATLDSVTDDAYKEVAEEFRKRDCRITIHGPFMDLSPGSPDPMIRAVTKKRMDRLVSVVEIFKPETVVCHGGWEKRRYGWMEDLWYETAIAFWQEVAEGIHGAGSRLLLENVYETDPQELMRLLRPLTLSGVGCCLDTGHQAAFGPGEFQRWVETVGPYVGEIHLHDNNGGDDDHLPPGAGGIDFSPLVSFLEDCKDLPVITLEPHREQDLWPGIRWLAGITGHLF